jgi:hypothetical protein
MIELSILEVALTSLVVSLIAPFGVAVYVYLIFKLASKSIAYRARQYVTQKVLG